MMYVRAQVGTSEKDSALTHVQRGREEEQQEDLETVALIDERARCCNQSDCGVVPMKGREM